MSGRTKKPAIKVTSPRSPPRSPRSPSLNRAIHNGKTGEVQQLIENNVEEIAQTDALGWSPLHHAAFVGAKKSVELLIRNGADINAQNREGMTPLHLAIATSRTKVASLLVKNGADLEVKDCYGRSPSDITEQDQMQHILQDSKKSPLLIVSPRTKSARKRLSFTSPSVPRPQLRSVSDSAPQETSGDEKSDSQEEKKAENWRQRTWRTAKRVAKWQILRYIVQILLCLLLELFVDHLKRVLQIFVLLRPLEALYIIINPIIVLLEPLRLLLWPMVQPLVTPVITLLSPFLSVLFNFLSIFTPLLSFVFQTLIFLATRTRAVFSPLFSVLYKLLLDPLHKLLTMFASVLWMVISPILSIIFKLLEPFWEVLKQIGLKIFGLLYGHMKTLMQKAFQALQPMMNINGFLSRVFNVLIAGLRAVLHWLLPDTILDKIQHISSRIFQVDNEHDKKSKDKNTEEAALVVIFMFIIVVYGSIFMSGYIFKVLFKVFTADIFAHSIFSVYGERMFGVLETIRILYKKEPEEIDFFSWGWFFKPDLIHHALGIAITTVFLAMMLLVKFIRFVFVALKWTGKKMIGACRRCRNRKRSEILARNNGTNGTGNNNDSNDTSSTKTNGVVNLHNNPVAAIKAGVSPVKRLR